LAINTPQGDTMKKSFLLTAIIGLAATTVISCNTTKSMTAGKTAKENSMTQIEKAQALIGTFASGDTERARSLLAEGYISTTSLTEQEQKHLSAQLHILQALL